MTDSSEIQAADTQDVEAQQRPWWATFQKYDPDGFASFHAWYTHQSTPRELDMKSYELIIVAIDALVAWPSPFFDIHINGAFDCGASILEVHEAILTAAQFGGGHALNHGLTTMEQVIQERLAAGKPTPERHTEMRPHEDR